MRPLFASLSKFLRKKIGELGLIVANLQAEMEGNTALLREVLSVYSLYLMRIL